MPRAPGRCSGEVLVRTSYVRNTASRKRSLRGVCTHTQGDVAVWRNGSSDGKGRDRSWSAAAGSPRKAPLAQQKGGSRRDSIEQSGGELTSTKSSTTPHNAQSVPNPSAKGRAPRPFEIPRPSVRIQRRPLRLRAWARMDCAWTFWAEKPRIILKRRFALSFSLVFRSFRQEIVRKLPRQGWECAYSSRGNSGHQSNDIPYRGRAYNRRCSRQASPEILRTRTSCFWGPIFV